MSKWIAELSHQSHQIEVKQKLVQICKLEFLSPNFEFPGTPVTSQSIIWDCLKREEIKGGKWKYSPHRINFGWGFFGILTLSLLKAQILWNLGLTSGMMMAITPLKWMQTSPKSILFGSSSTSSKLYSGRCCGSCTAIGRAYSASSFGGTFSDDEFSKKIEEMKHEPPDWGMLGEEMMMARKANSLDLPISLRMIKRRRQRRQNQESYLSDESSYCSEKKAFASMVFIIREVHSYSLQTRELLSYEDSAKVLARLEQEIQDSFVWLFEQVFSQTPTLMVYVMLLLANFTVDSMATNISIVSSQESAFEAALSILKAPAAREEQALVPSLQQEQEEENMWKWILGEASRLQSQVRGESLDSETVQSFVAPLKVQMDSDEGYAEYSMTELRYLISLAKEPNNPLLLANFAQFLYLVVRDYVRAEKYFKKATSIEPKDAEACYKYANFLWNTKKDLGAAEDTYLEAMSGDPGNTYYASTYAHFLWNTGGKDTCFPVNTPEDGDPCDA